MRSFLIAVVAMSLTTSGVTAQANHSAQRPTRVPVTVVLLDGNADEPFRIDRRLTEPRDVIALRADATKDDLANAVRALLVIRQVGGDTAIQAARMRMRPHPGQALVAQRAIPWAGRVFADLRRAEPQSIPGVGRLRAVRIWLPAQHQRFAH
jgi:hypothetical protein